MSALTEFGAEYAASLPSDIPACLEDTSWHNDVCGSWRVRNCPDNDYGLVLWIDFVDPSAREWSESRRYLVERNAGATVLYCGDDWAEARRVVLGNV